MGDVLDAKNSCGGGMGNCHNSPSTTLPTIDEPESYEWEYRSVETLVKNIRNLTSHVEIPLTASEIRLLLRTWQCVRDNFQQTAVYMFRRMLENNEAAREVFTALRTTDDGRYEGTIKVHSIVVLSAIDEIIVNMDDSPAVVDLIIRQGIFHAKFGSMSAQIFWAIEYPFLEAVSFTIGPAYTTEVSKVFQTAIHFILSLLIDGFEHGVRTKFGPYGKR